MKEKKIKHHSLTGRIDMDLMRRAFRNVKRNRGAAGIDKVSIQMFEANLEDNLVALMRKLKGRSFVPQPVRRVYIPKDPLGTQMRPLGIPAVIDRVAQEVLRQLLEPIFGPLFHKNSFGFRPKRSAHGAIRSALACHAEGLTIVLDADISGFFDNIPHKVMMQAVCEEIADGNILTLIERFLKAGVMEDGIFKPTSVGTPQGGVLSPLIANITLNKLDWELDAQGYCFVRYADDFVVLCTDRAQAESALQTVQETLARLGLTLSPEKTEITTYAKGYAFLGFNLSSRSRTMRKKSERKFKDKVRQLTRRKHNFEPAKVIDPLNRVIRGTANYFGTDFGTHYETFRRLDKWTRMRMRCMKFKRKSHHDNCRMKKRSFRQLGLLSLLDYTAKK